MTLIVLPLYYDLYSQRNKEGDLWVTIDAKVYDLSKFADLHPGGKSVLLADDVRTYRFLSSLLVRFQHHRSQFHQSDRWPGRN